MKILFAPSEAKFTGGEKIDLNKDHFLFPELFEKQKEAFSLYTNFIKNSPDEQLMILFGTKKQDVIEHYKNIIGQPELCKSILRYDGVAYDYLDYKSMQRSEQKYVDQNLIIFSNLFGPLSATSMIPEYKLKQGEKLNDIALEKYYKEHFSSTLDNYFENEDIVDLRAGFYEKFYKISKPYTTMKFIKDGKVVSHWAKAYRGIILKNMAKNNIQNIDQLLNMNIETLNIEEIKQTKNKQEIVYSITS